ncbi:c-type cytochrome [Polymorphum gilvum]|uniref:Cytochrome c553-like protein n=1 Tax=Polymorphum gilvum (strain LMG 25793 / CGMCC 1.9160 / SL003B-26A1) TaxID=991905 RepID=F2J389_POLGS|nr:c-type cytochrome [Polymorphum gilvum]ADZ69896.1 Cytochrome c553-like protein [Polymorphum gilvum SL003B-26A1]
MLRAAVLGLGGVFLAQAVLANGATEASAGDPVAGRQKAGQCRTCHGLDGFARIPIAPHIGGEPASYIVHQLTAFRNGTRVHEMMSVVAKALDDQSIADLAAWYASHEASATLPGGASEDDAPAQCVACHGVTGLSQAEDAPNLAGETAIYIDTQLKAFRLGKRTHEIMSPIAAELSDEEIRAVADWYAAIRLEIRQAE